MLELVLVEVVGVAVVVGFVVVGVVGFGASQVGRVAECDQTGRNKAKPSNKKQLQRCGGPPQQEQSAEGRAIA